VLRLIRVRFPKLIPHVNPTVLPMELAAMLARREAAADTGLRPEEIGVFAIVPCSAKATAAHERRDCRNRAGRRIFHPRCLPQAACPMKERGKAEKLYRSERVRPRLGVRRRPRARRASTSTASRVDGIENVIRMLGEIEDGRFSEAAFIELSACVQGCVGGCLRWPILYCQTACDETDEA
jgi:iron only hydrogenase large subunit-like protein